MWVTLEGDSPHSRTSRTRHQRQLVPNNSLRELVERFVCVLPAVRDVPVPPGSCYRHLAH
jgi:hypothetical protein